MRNPGKAQAGGTILVAGGAGFIGSHLCAALLDAGANVTCIDNMQTALPSNLPRLAGRDRFTFIEADITQPLPDAITADPARWTHIYNLACAASPPLYQADPEHTMLTNVVGTNQLLRLAEQAGARFLLTSTSEVYGDPEVHPQPEDYRGNVSCTGPRACYDEGKRAAETLTFDYARMNRADVRVARIFNTYGPQMRMDDGRVVSNLIVQALEGAKLTIYGSGAQTRSFCYVADTVDALIRLMDSEMVQPLPVNIGNQNEITILELVTAMEAVAGRSLDVTYHDLPQDDPQRRRPDITRARNVLGWEPTTPLAAGLRHTYDWFAGELTATAPLSAQRVA
ncbi:UDP-glucuronic acid decarboxylase family protein [Croceibacterium sp. TMG7-5b_MA50]|uniref:UDP-glucuronic acid decarboxylase family protein n=1 Tax=Croceibacterium sp. TMG7-5b_MA50 TaxID=3121290 RepID=UPI0032213C69